MSNLGRSVTEGKRAQYLATASQLGKGAQHPRHSAGQGSVTGLVPAVPYTPGRQLTTERTLLPIQCSQETVTLTLRPAKFSNTWVRAGHLGPARAFITQHRYLRRGTRHCRVLVLQIPAGARPSSPRPG